MTYNVNGNASYSARNEFKIQFGPINQFTVSSTTEADHSTYADMIGTDVDTPEPRKVRTLRLRERASFSWQIGRQNLKLFADFTSRRTTTPDPAFRDINARHYIAGFTGQFKLPAGFGIGTDFTMYCRDGYGMSQIDDTNLIWNARVTWTPPRAKAWTIMADGFDMLHQLKTINYAVTASGRSVSYTNALPRYFMLSVQYRFNRQPKKR